MNKMVLIGCEESQTITKAFRKLGIEAFSCDIKPCSGGKPEWHLQMDLFEAIKLHKWDLLIAHPECTYLSVSGACWYYHPDDSDLPISERRTHPLYPDRAKDRDNAKDFFMKCINADIPRIVVENPIGIMSTHYRKPDQIIHPFMFGEEARKATCLWLKNVPKLISTNIVGEGKIQYLKSGRKMPEWYSNAPKADRKAIRSKTFEGIANAMAEQWSKLLI